MKQIIYSVFGSNNKSYFTQFDSINYGVSFDILFEDGTNLSIERNLSGKNIVFSKTPIKIEKVSTNSILKGFLNKSDDKDFIDIVNYYEFYLPKGFKNYQITDYNDFEGSIEDFTEQIKFHEKYKVSYNQVKDIENVEFSIIFTELENKYIKPVIKFNSADENFYTLNYSIIAMIKEIALKHGFNFKDNDRNLGDYDFTCNDSGNFIRFKHGYASNTKLGDLSNQGKFPSTKERCEEIYKSIYDKIEIEFFLALNKVNPKEIGQLSLTDFYKDLDFITDKVKEISYTKKTYNSYVALNNRINGIKEKIKKLL